MSFLTSQFKRYGKMGHGCGWNVDYIVFPFEVLDSIVGIKLPTNSRRYKHGGPRITGPGIIKVVNINHQINKP